MLDQTASRLVLAHVVNKLCASTDVSGLKNESPAIRNVNAAWKAASEQYPHRKLE